MKFSDRFSCLYKHGQSPLNLWRQKINTINVILCPAGLSNSLSFDTNSCVNKNYQIKWYGQGRRRRLLWISFQLTVLLKLFIHMTFVNNSLWKRELEELFRIPCFWERSLVIISVTKPIWYRGVFVKIFCSPTFRLGNSLVVEPLFTLIISLAFESWVNIIQSMVKW